MQQFSTPMMRQYMDVKKQYRDCLLFFRMGDFYELFMEDAHTGAQVLNITLTSKNGGKDGKIPMAGVPYHAVDVYIAKLVKAGYKVAICEQLSPPNKRGIVKRDVVRVVTPGTLLDETILEKKENNYIISLVVSDQSFALAVSDLSTGYFAILDNESEKPLKVLRDELARLHPSECILPDELYNDPELLKVLKNEQGINIYPFHAWESYTDKPEAVLHKHFTVKTLAGFGITQITPAIKAAAALLGYLQETQKSSIAHIRKITKISNEKGLQLDRSTMINLELFATIREHETRGSLLSVLDQTTTAMGGRMLKQLVKKPLTDKDSIEKRYDAIDAILEHPELRDLLRDQLRQIPDIERLFSRLSVGLGNARDLTNLKQAIQAVLECKKILNNLDAKLLRKVADRISDDLTELISLVSTSIVDEPPISIRDGGLIREGINTELDFLRKSIEQSKIWITELEKNERARTGIGSLKVKFNKVFGFYIEISKSNLHLIPSDYMRKQTLVNGERFITEELKKHEEVILTAEEKINDLEYQLFLDTVQNVLEYTESIQKAAEAIATSDCLACFAYIAEKNRYCRPKLLYSGEIRIKQGRHPVVEQLLDTMQFVPNDTTLDNISQSLLLLTGPNMAGKSVYIRQVALIVLMAQMGCYVPAESAHISITDQIFVRSGASDVITSGLSTFMVEMVETAHILNNVTKNSLVIMDEIGRGTSTYDGISIAWAVAEYLVTNTNPTPKVLFATHYHELQVLEEQYPGKIKNFHMAVTEDKGEPVFLHTILPGGASHSFGVVVAKLAGIPESVTKRAFELLQELEQKSSNKPFPVTMPNAKYHIQHTDVADHLIQKELESVDVANMTPLEALNKLAELKEKLKLLTSSDSSFIDAD